MFLWKVLSCDKSILLNRNVDVQSKLIALKAWRVKKFEFSDCCLMHHKCIVIHRKRNQPDYDDWREDSTLFATIYLAKSIYTQGVVTSFCRFWQIIKYFLSVIRHLLFLYLIKDIFSIPCHSLSLWTNEIYVISV